MVKRVFDLTLAGALLVLLALPMLIIALAVKLTSQGPILHWSKRIGKHNKIFLMPKFRSMKVTTPQLATHLLTNSENYLTPIGGLIRKTSLDEVPQLFSVLSGDMSFVGPRPALFNQDDLVQLRTERGLSHLRPGITGWAQINGRDELPIPIKVEFDYFYFKNYSLWLDLKILGLTVFKVLRAEGVQH
jgi:O-antigen biosynthesis protein WbqP